MHRSPGAPPADTAPIRTRRDSVGRRSRWDLSTLRELWRFKDYGRPERKSLVLGMLMNGGQMAANLAAPWPLALVIDDLLQDKGQGKGQAQSPTPRSVTSPGLLYRSRSSSGSAPRASR